MKDFLLCYTEYDCDNYRGHRLHDFQAVDRAAAETEAKRWMTDQLWHWRCQEPGRSGIEWRLVEVAPGGKGHYALHHKEGVAP